jgi:hypothetical protein
MCEATAADKPLPTIFGGIVAITLFGPKAVDAFLLPLIIPYFKKWEASLDKTHNLEKQVELQHCQQAIMVRRNDTLYLWWLILYFRSHIMLSLQYRMHCLCFCNESVRENRLHGLSMRSWKMPWERNWWCCRMLQPSMLHVYCNGEGEDRKRCWYMVGLYVILIYFNCLSSFVFLQDGNQLSLPINGCRRGFHGIKIRRCHA